MRVIQKGMSPVKKIALFGGSFDPPHVGHVQVVLTALERKIVDEIWIVLTRKNPLKQVPFLELDIRKAMVQATFSPIPCTKIVCEENEYTIDTVRSLKKRYPELRESSLFFLIGSDAFQQRKAWKEWNAVMREGSFLVMNRWGEKPKEGPEEEDLRVVFIDAPRFDTSSTDIRGRFHEKKYIAHLVHPTVEKLMVESV